MAKAPPTIENTAIATYRAQRASASSVAESTDLGANRKYPAVGQKPVLAPKRRVQIQIGAGCAAIDPVPASQRMPPPTRHEIVSAWSPHFFEGEMLSSQPMTRQPTHSLGPKRRFTGDGSRIAVSPSSDFG